MKNLPELSRSNIKSLEEISQWETDSNTNIILQEPTIFLRKSIYNRYLPEMPPNHNNSNDCTPPKQTLKTEPTIAIPPLRSKTKTITRRYHNQSIDLLIKRSPYAVHFSQSLPKKSTIHKSSYYCEPREPKFRTLENQSLSANNTFFLVPLGSNSRKSCGQTPTNQYKRSALPNLSKDLSSHTTPCKTIEKPDHDSTCNFTINRQKRRITTQNKELYQTEKATIVCPENINSLEYLIEKATKKKDKESVSKSRMKHKDKELLDFQKNLFSYKWLFSKEPLNAIEIKLS